MWRLFSKELQVLLYIYMSRRIRWIASFSYSTNALAWFAYLRIFSLSFTTICAFYHFSWKLASLKWLNVHFPSLWKCYSKHSRCEHMNRLLHSSTSHRYRNFSPCNGQYSFLIIRNGYSTGASNFTFSISFFSTNTVWYAHWPFTL